MCLFTIIGILEITIGKTTNLPGREYKKVPLFTSFFYHQVEIGKISIFYHYFDVTVLRLVKTQIYQGGGKICYSLPLFTTHPK